MAEIERAPSEPQRTVAFDDAARMAGIPGEYLAQLLEARTVGYELVGGERRIPVSEIAAYRERRAGALLALRVSGALHERR